MEMQAKYVTHTTGTLTPIQAFELGTQVIYVLTRHRLYGQNVTTADMAQQLGASEFDVFLAIKRLQAAGYPIADTRDEPRRYYFVTPTDNDEFGGDVMEVRARRTAKYLRQAQAQAEAMAR